MNEAEFLKDVGQHAMQVLRDDGVYRHIRFKRPESSSYYFDLITWPGAFCYTGDMGTFVFSRLKDMFEFFRADRDHGKRQGKGLFINPGYWSEKLLAVDGNRDKASAKEFDADRFREAINEYRTSWMRQARDSGALDKTERRELWEAVDDQVLSALDEGGDRAMYAAYDFNWRPDYEYDRERPSWHFVDLFEHRFTRYTRTFLWCCYAMAWGIEKYDEARAVTEAQP